jgi:hypothetical protein
MTKPHITLLACLSLLGAAVFVLGDPSTGTYIVGEGAVPWSDKNDWKINHIPPELVGNGPFPQTLFGSLSLNLPAGAKSVLFSVSPDDLPLLQTNNPTLEVTGESLSIMHPDGTGSIWPIVKLVSPPAQIGGTGFHSGIILIDLNLNPPTPAQLLAQDPSMPTIKVADLKLDYAERNTIEDKGFRALIAKNYAEIEQTDNTMVTTNALLTDGTQQSDSYEDGFLRSCKTEADWKARISDTEAWCAAEPDSVFAPSVLANEYLNYAWFARGDGYADTVTAEGNRLMVERLAKAREILEKARSQHPTETIPPIWYRAMEGVALGQGWPVPDRYQLFQEETAKYPNDYRFYFGEAYFLMEKW